MEQQVNDPQNPKITILGKEHFFKDLPEDVQKMVALYNAWQTELAKQQAEVMKLELAVRGVSQDIMKAMSETVGEPLNTAPAKSEENVMEVITVKAKQCTGTVEWYNDAKGYGFIKPDDSSESIYVHFSDIISDSAFRTLKDGQRVSYYVRSDAKGNKAVDVSELDS